MIHASPIAALALLFLAQDFTPASANSYKQFYLTLDCRSFQASAKTVLTVPVNIASGVISQVIWVTHKAPVSTRQVDLYQHRSADPFNHERSVTDAIAWDWRCFRSRFGLDYLFVEFNCRNESARTCHTAMDLPGGEWTGIYDSYGKTVGYGEGGWTEDAEKHLRSLGLLDELGSWHHAEPDFMLYTPDPG